GRERGAPAERPPHAVWIDAFEIAVTPATNADYARYRDAAGAGAPPFVDRAGFDDPQQPVVGLAWDEAAAFAAWLHARLPTEAAEHGVTPIRGVPSRTARRYRPTSSTPTMAFASCATFHMGPRI